jgi:hypothetical protein
MKREMVFVFAGILLLTIASFFFIQFKFKNSLSNNLKEIQFLPDQGADYLLSTGQMIDCGVIENPTCFSQRFEKCLPVRLELITTDNSRIELFVLGIEEEKCHLQRKVNSILNQECYFPNKNLNWDLIDQTLGNEKGLQDIVDSSCQKAGLN